MPEGFKKIYESLNRHQIEMLESQSQNWKLDTQENVNRFWQTRNFSQNMNETFMQPVIQSDTFTDGLIAISRRLMQ